LATRIFLTAAAGADDDETTTFDDVASRSSRNKERFAAGAADIADTVAGAPSVEIAEVSEAALPLTW
jgi:hypothetical protein